MAEIRYTGFKDSFFSQAALAAENGTAYGPGSAYAVSEPSSNWFERTFDGSRVEQDYNAYQAAIDRKFQAEQNRLAYERSQKSADIAYERSAREAQKQRDYDERMSNTAYSRAVADMKSAGLNPYALYGGASAASTPSGATGSAYTASGGSGGSSGARIGASRSGIFDLMSSIATSAWAIAKIYAATA